MSHSSLFIGPADDAPASDLYGSLIAAEAGAERTVVIIPAGFASIETVSVVLNAQASHVSIVAEAGSHAHVVIEFAEGMSMVDASIEAFAASETTLTILTLQTARADTINIRQRSSVAEGGAVTWQNITLGGTEVTHDLVSTLGGHDAVSNVDWVFYAKENEKQTLTARTVFNGKNGGGEMTLKGVAEDKAHTRCEGLIEIGLGGGGTNTYLTEEVLMLDASSKVDAIPGLEIKTNDVKASHSATVARVTDEHLFYFASRGIDREEARRMFVLGFLGDITQRIESDVVREKTVRAIEEKYARA